MTLADYIYSDLRSRIDSGDGLPCKLTYLALSQHYEVSLTPVRSAVRRLIDAKYVSLLDNGRLELNRQASNGKKNGAIAEAPAPRRPADREREIRRDLIRESLTDDQSEQYIREEAAAAKYGVGRTVLRPILSRLAGTGLLEHVPRCGWRLRHFDKDDLSSFLVVRELLEVKALDQARPRLEVDTLRRLLEDNRSETRAGVGTLNNNLHAYWIGLSENRYIQEFFKFQAVYYTTVFDFAAPAAHVVKEMAQQHCEILEPLIEGRWPQAKSALVRHIRDQKVNVGRLIEMIREGKN